MNILVFGASGKVGRHVVERAIAASHHVTAFVRNPAKPGLLHDGLRIVQGDVHDAHQVREAVRGQEAVISVIGHTKTSRGDVLTELAAHLIPAMEEEGVRRLVSLVGAGVPDPADLPSIGKTLMRGAMKLFVRDMLHDAERHAAALRSSDLDWTLVRPPRLTDEPGRNEYRTGILKLGPTERISRADLAGFMLRLATSDEYVRSAPMISF